MAKIFYEVRCPSCSHVIRGQREPDERKLHLGCKKCGRSFFVCFHPDQKDLERAFLDGELRPDIIPRPDRPIEDNFPSAIFNFKERRRSGR